MSRWTIKLEEDAETGDLIMPFTPDMLSQVGWDIGDTLLWEEMSHGVWSLKKVEDGISENTSK